MFHSAVSQVIYIFSYFCIPSNLLISILSISILNPIFPLRFGYTMLFDNLKLLDLHNEFSHVYM